MLKCHNCGQTFITATASGIVARGRASVSFNDEGDPVLTSPIKLDWMVKSGKEMDGKRFNITCPHCNITDPVKLFRISRVSMLSDREATTSVTVGDYSIPVTDDEIDAALGLEEILHHIHNNASDHTLAFEMISSFRASGGSRSRKPRSE